MRNKLLNKKKIKYAECHSDRYYYAKDMCRSCYEIYLKSVNSEFKESQLENSRRWSLDNRELKISINKAYVENNKDKIKLSKRKWKNSTKYNITEEEYSVLFKEQNGVCYICTKASIENLCIDHDHITGRVRGLLCKACNYGLGCFKDNPEYLNKAAEYLKKDKQ